LDGENLIQYGDEVDYFYLIKKGKVSLFNKTFDYMYDLEEGSFFGE
jgi:signal-transduction protein with cAMP-binding, CBS, and nucleotidyltransferase domain